MHSVVDVAIMWRHEWDDGFRGTDDVVPSMQAPIIKPQAREHQTQIHDQTPILSDLYSNSNEVSRFMYM